MTRWQPTARNRAPVWPGLEFPCFGSPITPILTPPRVAVAAVSQGKPVKYRPARPKERTITAANEMIEE